MDTLVSHPAAAPQTVDLETQHFVEQFLYREAALLDDREWAAWESLFADDGTYWVPLEHGQTDPLNHASLFYEDATMREVRRRRLESKRAWSQQPVTRTARSVTNVQVLSGSPSSGKMLVRSSFQITEWARRKDQRQLAGHYLHTLVLVDDHWKIQQKRVDLINCDGVQSPFEVFL